MTAGAKTLRSLDWRLPEGYAFHFRHPLNRAYLDGSDAVPDVGGHGKVWFHIGRTVRAGALALFLVLLAFSLYSGLWNSSLAKTTSTTVLAVQGGGGDPQLAYSYQVDGATYSKVESPGSLHKSIWDEAGSSETIRYLSFWPERAHLDFRVEPFSWSLALSVQILVLSFAYGGHAMMKSQRQLERLVRGCTHVLPGKISRVINGNGYRNAVYEAQTPDSGKTFSGIVQIGDGDPRRNDFVAGAGVAVLFMDEKAHTLL